MLLTCAARLRDSRSPSSSAHFVPPAPARTADWFAIRAGQTVGSSDCWPDDRPPSPGGTSDQSCGALAPHRVTDEVTLLSTIPAPVAQACPQAFTTPQALVAGIARQSFFPMRRRRLSKFLLRDSNPRPLGRWLCRSNSAHHHATISLSFFLTSLLHYFLASCNAHTRSVSPPNSFRLAKETRRKISGRNHRSRPLGFEPRALRPLTIEVPVNFTIPGETLPRQNSLDRNDLGGLFTSGSRECAVRETRSPWHRSDLAFIF